MGPCQYHTPGAHPHGVLRARTWTRQQMSRSSRSGRRSCGGRIALLRPKRRGDPCPLISLGRNALNVAPPRGKGAMPSGPLALHTRHQQVCPPASVGIVICYTSTRPRSLLNRRRCQYPPKALAAQSSTRPVPMSTPGPDFPRGRVNAPASIKSHAALVFLPANVVQTRHLLVRVAAARPRRRQHAHQRRRAAPQACHLPTKHWRHTARTHGPGGRFRHRRCSPLPPAQRLSSPPFRCVLPAHARQVTYPAHHPPRVPALRWSWCASTQRRL